MALSPLVSVCIPCYNGEAFLSRTVESVLNQSLRDLEVVVVDDASSDGTVALMQRFDDSRIKLYRNERNLGMGANWNKAVSISLGKYVKLLCEDDLLGPECLARQVAALENAANSQAVLTLCNRTVIDAAGRVLLKRRMPFPPGLVPGGELIRRSIRWGTNLIGEPATGLFRRHILAKNVRFDPSNPYLIDLAFWADTLRHGDAYIEQGFLASFRVSGSAVSARLGYRQAALFRAFVRKLRQDPFYRISRLDLLAGCVFSLFWCFLRNLFLHLHTTRAERRRVNRGVVQEPSARGCGRMAKPQALC